MSYFTFATETWRNPGNYSFFPISRHFPALLFICKWFFLGVLGASNELEHKHSHRAAHCLRSGLLSWQSSAGDRGVPRWGLAGVSSSSGTGCWCPSTTQTRARFRGCSMKDPCQHRWVPLNIQVSPFITTSSSQKSQHWLKNNEICNQQQHTNSLNQGASFYLARGSWWVIEPSVVLYTCTAAYKTAICIYQVTVTNFDCRWFFLFNFSLYLGLQTFPLHLLRCVFFLFQTGERSHSYAPTAPSSGALETRSVTGIAEEKADLDAGCGLKKTANATSS